MTNEEFETIKRQDEWIAILRKDYPDYFGNELKSDQRQLATLLNNQIRYLDTAKTQETTSDEIALSSKQTIAGYIKQIYFELKEIGVRVIALETAKDTFEYGDNKVYEFRPRRQPIEDKDFVRGVINHIKRVKEMSNAKILVVGFLVPFVVDATGSFFDWAVLEKKTQKDELVERGPSMVSW